MSLVVTAHLSGTHLIDYAAFFIPVALLVASFLLARRMDKNDSDSDGREDDR